MLQNVQQHCLPGADVGMGVRAGGEGGSVTMDEYGSDSEVSWYYRICSDIASLELTLGWGWGEGQGGCLWRMDECGSDSEVVWCCRMCSDIASLELTVG